jgi:hypothetical protein
VITFDQTLAVVEETLKPHENWLAQMGLVIVNRDLNGRVRLILPADRQSDAIYATTTTAIAEELTDKLHPHNFPSNQIILYEDDMLAAQDGLAGSTLGDLEQVIVIDRLASEGRWSTINRKSEGAPRVVFFSIKGGVGRSTAMAVSAWSLAQAGQRVMVLDLDLESPGLSSGLLPEERRPAYGITDWLVEDLVENGTAVFEDMVATSELSHDGEIFVVPAHGVDPGNYIAKLGRVWMPKIDQQGRREGWSQRLSRMMNALEQRWKPDIILIDSRSGIDEVASSCVTDLGACLVLLFAIDGEQTWSGYQMLFDYWHQAGVAREIRERLQLVGAMIPETNGAEYLAGVRERSWDLFSEALYDEVPPGKTTDQLWNFDDSDDSAPHYPWPIKWHRGFAALTSLHNRLSQIDQQEVEAIYGKLIDGIGISTASRED